MRAGLHSRENLEAMTQTGKVSNKQKEVQS